MSRYIHYVLAGIVGLGSAGQAYAVDTTADAVATVTTPLAVLQTQALDFGELSPSATAGTIVASTGATTGGVTQLNPGNDAGFTVTGQPSTTVNITVDPTATLSSNGNSMTANLTAPATANLNGGGNAAFNVDGTLQVAANQPSGVYNGTYNVSVNY